jgi:hypothetical protein
MLEKKIFMYLFMLICISACGGGGGGGSDSSSTDYSSTDSSSIDSYSDLFEQAYSIINKNIGWGEVNINNSDLNDSYLACVHKDYVSKEALDDFVEEELEFSLCGKQEDGDLYPVCLYPGEDAFRTVAVPSDETYEGAEEEINIPLAGGEIEIYLNYSESYLDYRLEAQNNVQACNTETLGLETTFSGIDIKGEYEITAVGIDENGIPVTEASGNITCVEDECSGEFGIIDLVYDISTQSWTGLLTFKDREYDLVATLSPDKSVAVLVGLPFLTEGSPQAQEFTQECLFIGAKSK